MGYSKNKSYIIYSNHVNMNKKIKIIYFAILLFCFISFFIFGYIKHRNARKSWEKSYYQGTIAGIFPNEFSRGDPQIRFENNKLIQLGLSESCLFSYIQIGDSIVKNSGSAFVFVFRKDEKGNWVEKEFDCK